MCPYHQDEQSAPRWMDSLPEHHCIFELSLQSDLFKSQLQQTLVLGDNFLSLLWGNDSSPLFRATPSSLKPCASPSDRGEQVVNTVLATLKKLCGPNSFSVLGVDVGMCHSSGRGI